jgi:hypothetical protein
MIGDNLAKYYSTVDVNLGGQSLWSSTTILWPDFLTLVSAIVTFILSVAILHTSGEVTLQLAWTIDVPTSPTFSSVFELPPPLRLRLVCGVLAIVLCRWQVKYVEHRQIKHLFSLRSILIDFVLNLYIYPSDFVDDRMWLQE